MHNIMKFNTQLLHWLLQVSIVIIKYYFLLVCHFIFFRLNLADCYCYTTLAVMTLCMFLFIHGEHIPSVDFIFHSHLQSFFNY